MPDKRVLWRIIAACNVPIRGTKSQKIDEKAEAIEEEIMWYKIKTKDFIFFLEKRLIKGNFSLHSVITF